MEIAFDSLALRSMCEDQDEAKRIIGDGPSQSLRHRLADLHAARSVVDIVVGNPRTLDGSENMRIDLCEGYCISMRANHVDRPVTVDGNLDWLRVTRIKILSVGVIQ